MVTNTNTSQVSKYYHTIDRNRLQIADSDSKYMGSINSYNNAITRFFADLCDLSMKIDINGKTRHVNINSYHKFLRLHTNITFPTALICTTHSPVYSYINFSQTMDKHGNKNTWENNGYICVHLSNSKSLRLGEKLIRSIWDGKYPQAIDYAGKGADIEIKFWDRGNYGLSFQACTNLDFDHSMQIPMKSHSPLSYVTQKSSSDTNYIVNYLKTIGATDYKMQSWTYRYYLFASDTLTRDNE